VALSGIAMKNGFTIVIEQNEDDMYVASVPKLEGCHTQVNSRRAESANQRGDTIQLREDGFYFGDTISRRCV
jgi:hypothetical protein